MQLDQTKLELNQTEPGDPVAWHYIYNEAYAESVIAYLLLRGARWEDMFPTNNDDNSVWITYGPNDHCVEHVILMYYEGSGSRAQDEYHVWQVNKCRYEKLLRILDPKSNT